MRTRQHLMHQPSLEKELCMHKCFLSLLALICAFLLVPSVHAQDTRKPNILVIMGDDIGQTNISAYSRGLMGFTTPNIDRIANEGACSSTTMASSPAPRVVPRSSSGRARFARG